MPQLKLSLQRILEYLHNYTIVDLQLIIPKTTGYAVVIDSAAIYEGLPDEQDKQDTHHQVKVELAQMIKLCEPLSTSSFSHRLSSKQLEDLYLGADDEPQFMEQLVKLCKEQNYDPAQVIESLKEAKLMDEKELQALLETQQFFSGK